MTAITQAIGFLYRNALKRVFFLQDPEKVHLRMMGLGETLGNISLARTLASAVFQSENSSLEQNILGLNFKTPIGLAAGFDYEARLTQILPALGFGFGTVGTLTYEPYGGNPRPMLGRLPKSQSLMVNKGFKNLGVGPTLERLAGLEFDYPVGVSIGKTNKGHATQTEAVKDVVAGFEAAESSSVPFAYYELNVSCPNLIGNVEFYDPAHLEELLRALETLRIARPVLVKMPISKTDGEIRGMLEVIAKHDFLKAVIFGNLQRDRRNPALHPEEVARFDRGNFSGVPCRARSDELIRLAYKNYGSALAVIGCGGVFSPEDAYRKIKLGASLVELITGLIYQGPQLVSQINQALPGLLKKDGFSHISQAVGVDA